MGGRVSAAAPRPDRDAVIRRIRALREMTTGNGCTEAEALAAAGKLAAMMAEHGVSDDEIAMNVARAPISRRRRYGQQGSPARRQLWAAIGTLTNTVPVILHDGDGWSVSYVGTGPSPEVASYLREVCDGALLRETDLFKQGDYYRRRKLTRTKADATRWFQRGMVHRLIARLHVLFEAGMDAKALQRAERHVKGTMSTTPGRAMPARVGRTNWNALTAGYAAGGKPTLGYGVGRGAHGALPPGPSPSAGTIGTNAR